MYQARYNNSYALIIGINDYEVVGPLDYACNDANKVAETLESHFDFPNGNITLLLDGEASRENIYSAYMHYTDSADVVDDDRILMFFAGHGHTRRSGRGEVGYLVPADGDINNTASLLRWDDFTRNADLIAAKHMLFVMDACYGGLAAKRALPPGSTRFMKDMLMRPSRQVLTAGKADEPVDDGGGPRDGHSMFTGHLLDALEGAAAAEDGVITANSVMAYTYDKVSKDQYSTQTPHYSYIDGDGDFIFNPNVTAPDDQQSKTDNDILITVPASFSAQEEAPILRTGIEQLKEYLSEKKDRIKLDDFLTVEIRSLLHVLGREEFSVHETPVNEETVISRLNRYESVTATLQQYISLLGKWADERQLGFIEKIISKVCDANTATSGVNLWISMQWYPTFVMVYSCGIAALSAKNYGALKTLLTAEISDHYRRESSQSVIVPLVDNILEMDRANVFKHFPEYKQKYVPRSEYMFKSLQPLLEDLLLLGSQYEPLFDRFEVIYALVYADHEAREGRFWAPPGRFAWKYSQGHGTGRDPLSQFLNEGRTQKQNWPILQAGLFNGSYDRFEEIASAYEEFIRGLKWW